MVVSAIHFDYITFIACSLPISLYFFVVVRHRKGKVNFLFVKAAIAGGKKAFYFFKLYLRLKQLLEIREAASIIVVKCSFKIASEVRIERETFPCYF